MKNKYDINVSFDEEMGALLEDEGISIFIVQEAIQTFIKDRHVTIDEFCTLLVPFQIANGKRYSFYGTCDAKEDTIEFEIELLGISMK